VPNLPVTPRHPLKEQDDAFTALMQQKAQARTGGMNIAELARNDRGMALTSLDHPAYTASQVFAHALGLIDINTVAPAGYFRTPSPVPIFSPSEMALRNAEYFAGAYPPGQIIRTASSPALQK
jgi:hypothetical protein